MMVSKFTACSTSLALALLLAAPAAADDLGAPDLHTWGKLAPVKKTDFFELTYKEVDGRKRRTQKAFLSLAEAAFYVDRAATLEEIAEGDTVWVYGKPIERSSQTDDGRTLVDRQIVNTLAVASGDALTVEVDDVREGPAGQKWLQATVSRSGENMHVTYDGQEYKVVCLKGYAVLVRQALEEAPKLTKKLMVEVEARVSEEKPEKAKEDDLSFAVSRIVILDKRLQRVVYPLLFQ